MLVCVNIYKIDTIRPVAAFRENPMQSSYPPTNLIKHLLNVIMCIIFLAYVSREGGSFVPFAVARLFM